LHKSIIKENDRFQKPIAITSTQYFVNIAYKCYLIFMHKLSLKTQEILRFNNINAVLLFGSQATKFTTKDSDTDVALFANKRLTPEVFSSLRPLLAKDFNCAPEDIDLIDLRSVNPLTAFLAVTEGKLLFGSTESFDNLYRRAVSAHIDAQTLYQMDRDYVHSAS